MIYPILDQDCRALLSLVTFTTLCLLSCSLQVTWGEYKLIAMRRVACFQENGENLDSWIILDGEEWLSNERRELTAVDITLLGKWHRLENTADKTDERWMKSWAVFSFKIKIWFYTDQLQLFLLDLGGSRWRVRWMGEYWIDLAGLVAVHSQACLLLDRLWGTCGDVWRQDGGEGGQTLKILSIWTVPTEKGRHSEPSCAMLCKSN